jgi:adenine-specific DNA-methyltransferase
VSVSAIQPSLFPTAALWPISTPDEQGEHGEVFTRSWVVEFILDLCGYTEDRNLASLVAVEPSCGSGAFLVPMVKRLSASLRRHHQTLDDAIEAISAFDLLPRNAHRARESIVAALVSEGWPRAKSKQMATLWVSTADYILTEHQPSSVDFVIGNPPYIRLEDIAPDHLAQYRSTCETMGGRADVYVAFFEIGLRTLRKGGTLGFICADRWMRNQYGARLRDFITSNFHLAASIEAHDVDAFEEQVSAYPSITVIKNDKKSNAIFATTNKTFGEEASGWLMKWAQTSATKSFSTPSFRSVRLPHAFTGESSWPTGSPERLALLEALNDRFGPLEDQTTGTRVGIGVATGADAIYVVKSNLDIEPDRLLPLVMSKDIGSGKVAWSGYYLVNPWSSSGAPVELSKFPKLEGYFDEHRELIMKRNVAGRSGEAWFRTIDKVDHSLIKKEKLLFPDMKMATHPVLEPGGLYPHHNLYFVVSTEWDLRVLGGLLLSKVAEFFVDSYAVRMRGGTLRFQAQYLRRIRVPRPADIPSDLAHDLASAFERRDNVAATKTALAIYGLEGIPE